MKCLWVSFLILTCGLTAMAQGSSLRTTVSPNPRREAPKDWNLTLAAASKTDLNKPESKRPYTHNLDISFGYDWLKDLSISMGTGLEMKADGNNVRNEEGNPAWNDLNVSLGWKTGLFSNSTLTLSASEDLPTGTESRAEEVKSVIGAEAALTSHFLNKRIFLASGASVSRIIQTFDYSPTTLESNPDTLTTAGLNLSYIVNGGWAVGVSGNAQSVHFINGENALRTSTSEFIAYRYRNWKFNLSYSFGNYDKNDSYKLLYLDETRRVIKLGVKVEI